MQDIMKPIHSRMGRDNRHTALIIDIRLRIGYTDTCPINDWKS